MNLSNFNTYKIINMSHMFSECCSLKEIIISNFNTNDNAKMDNLFHKCSDKLKEEMKNKYKNMKKEAFY